MRTLTVVGDPAWGSGRVPRHQTVDLRQGLPPRAQAFADSSERDAWLVLRDAARRAQPTKFAVTLDHSITLRDGRVLGSLTPVDPSEVHAGDLRRWLRDGLVTERHDLPEPPPEPAA